MTHPQQLNSWPIVDQERRRRDFIEALTAILGKEAAGLSAANIMRLKDVWQQEYEEQ